MTRRTLIRCLVVSVVIALITPLFMFVVIAPIGPDGNPLPMMAFHSNDPMPSHETRQLFGLEKYRYMFTGGWWRSWVWLIYLKESAWYFLIALVSSLAVCFWNAKATR